MKGTGLVQAYESFLRSLCVGGLPEQNILYEKAAQYILKYEKNMKRKVERQKSIESYNQEILRKNKEKVKDKSVE